jgi:predicted ribosomally synthesized peptide with SipW-like signal peptide
MSEKDVFDLSRRKVLAGLGTIGAASAGIGLGTSAYFSDEESFVNNSLVAGELDMKMGYSAHYSDWSPDEGEGVDVVMWDGAPNTTGSPGDLPDGYTGLPTNAAWLIAVDDPDQFLANTQYLSDGIVDCGPEGTDSGDLEQPVIEIEDVKPGDFGEVTFDFALCDNPGYVWLQGELLSCAENGVTEPEAEDEDENEDEPREGSLWPLLAAGAIPSASSLFDNDAGEKVSETVEKAVESDSISRKDVLKGAAAGTAGAAGIGAMTGTAAAVPGDSLATGTLSGTPNGAGLTFDGDYAYTVGFSGTTVRVYEPLDGGSKNPVAEKTLSDPIDVIEWDPDEGQFWGVQSAGFASDPEFFTFDLGDPTVTESVSGTSRFTVSGVNKDDLLDGFAYDGTTETFWLSGDGTQDVWQFDKSGNQVNRITPEFNEDGDVFDWISGIAVGAPKNDRPTLYLGNNPEAADGDIGRVYADDGEFISTFATSTDFRVEDIACDPVTFEGEALLVRDNFDLYEVFEVEEGTCPVAGEPEPEPEPTECADVELLDAVQAAAWVDDGDNYQDGEEEPVVSGSLRDVLGTLSSGTGLGLAGDIPAEEGGGIGRNCFSAETEHSVAFAWWVPIDHGNEIQTDSASFELSFYTEQCRHNDGSGMATEASVNFEDQESDGSSVLVDSVTLPDGGYVVIHASDDGAPGDVLGNSPYLSAGTSSDVTVSLDPPISSSQELIAMAHMDDGDQEYEFPGDDGPYTKDGAAVIDAAQITLPPGD